MHTQPNEPDEQSLINRTLAGMVGQRDAAQSLTQETSL